MIFMYQKGEKSITDSGLRACSTIIFPKYSIIFSKRAPVGQVAINSEELCTNQGCLACIPKNNIKIKYYYYTLSVFTKEFELLSAGTTFKEISIETFANFKLLFSSLDTQSRIADYLDDKCGKIDRYIETQRTIIEKPKAYYKNVEALS